MDPRNAPREEIRGHLTLAELIVAVGIVIFLVALLWPAIGPFLDDDPPTAVLPPEPVHSGRSPVERFLR